MDNLVNSISFDEKATKLFKTDGSYKENSAKRAKRYTKGFEDIV